MTANAKKKKKRKKRVKLNEIGISIPKKLAGLKYENRFGIEHGYMLHFMNISTDIENDPAEDPMDVYGRSALIYVYEWDKLEKKHHIHHLMVKQHFYGQMQQTQQMDGPKVIDSIKIDAKIKKWSKNKFRVHGFELKKKITSPNEIHQTWILLTAINGYFLKIRYNQHGGDMHEVHNFIQTMCSLIKQKKMSTKDLETALNDEVARRANIPKQAEFDPSEFEFDEKEIEEKVEEVKAYIEQMKKENPDLAQRTEL